MLRISIVNDWWDYVMPSTTPNPRHSVFQVFNDSIINPLDRLTLHQARISTIIKEGVHIDISPVIQIKRDHDPSPFSQCLDSLAPAQSARESLVGRFLRVLIRLTH